MCRPAPANKDSSIALGCSMWALLARVHKVLDVIGHGLGAEEIPCHSRAKFKTAPHSSKTNLIWTLTCSGETVQIDLHSLCGCSAGSTGHSHLQSGCSSTNGWWPLLRTRITLAWPIAPSSSATSHPRLCVSRSWRWSQSPQPLPIQPESPRVSISSLRMDPLLLV